MTIGCKAFVLPPSCNLIPSENDEQVEISKREKRFNFGRTKTKTGGQSIEKKKKPRDDLDFDGDKFLLTTGCPPFFDLR